MKKLVTPTGFEPVITGMKALCPGPLDEGAITSLNYIEFALY